jgi:energy-converting hydrogenase Eha subunit C
MTFVVYVATVLLGAVPVLPIVFAIGAAPDRPGGGAMLELLEEAAPTFAASIVAGFAVATVFLVLSPLLQMAWLASLASPMSIAEALFRGARRYLDAVLVSLLMLVPLVVVAFASITPPLVAHLFLGEHPNDRLHDVVVLALLVPGFFLWLAWCTWHDLARAALLVCARPLDAVRESFRKLGAAAFGAYLAWSVLAALLAVLGHILGMELESGALAILLLQPLALARLACRAAWLSDAIARVYA